MNRIPPELLPLRRTIPLSFDAFYEQIMNLAIAGMNLQAEKVFTPKSERVGVFGPYPEGGEEIIDEVAKLVAKLGFGALTAKGFYHPNEPEEFHEIEGIMPPLVKQTLDFLDIPDYIYFRHFPRLVTKAVHHLSPLRGQRNEVEGCNSWGIPMLGFILGKDTVSIPKKTCNYLVDQKTYVECFCPSKDFCFHEVWDIHCPFYEKVNIPWATKQLFLTRRNPLVAIAKLLDLEQVLKKFIGQFYVNHL